MKKYQLIYADPPWSYRFSKPTASKGGAKGNGYSGGVSYYYSTMSMGDIERLPIGELSDKRAVLFLWATNPLLPEALNVMKAWGFNYKTNIIWHKGRCKGMGYWFRGHTEVLLFGIKGNVKAFKSLEHNIVSLPVENHSKKPDWFRRFIERNTVGLESRIELFARQKTEGWDVWGDEVENDIEL